MYKCCMCKKEMYGNPAMENKAGKFCELCKDAINYRSNKARESIKAEWDGCCLWCGCKITHVKNDARNCYRVCNACVSRRDWLLKVIRFSDRPARYIERTEAKEGPKRRERDETRKVEQIKPENQNQQTLKLNEDTCLASRMERMEAMLNKLSKALGE